MKRRVHAIVLTVVLFAAGVPVVSAHHSFAAAYDTSKSFTVKGTLNRVRLTNPHSWFFIDVKDAATGKTTEWAFEAGTPSGMIRNGYKVSELPTGSEVTIQGRPAKDPTVKAGMLVELTTAAGKVYRSFGPVEGGATR